MTRSCKKRLPRAPASLSSPTRSATIAMPLLVLSLLPPARSGGSTQDGDQRRPLVILLGTASGLVARTREVGLGERRAHSCILFFESVRSWTGHSMQRRIVCPPSLQSISCEHDSGFASRLLAFGYLALDSHACASVRQPRREAQTCGNVERGLQTKSNASRFAAHGTLR